MAFNFMAALGGFGTQVSANLESAKEFKRQKDFKLELLAEEEATKNRLRKSAERKEKQELLEQVTQGLAYYIGADHAAATVKTYGATQATAFLNSLGDYEGDVSVALKLPEIENGVYGSQLVEGAGAPPSLSSFLTLEEESPDLPTTVAQWQINYNQDLTDANAMPDGPEKTELLSKLEQDLEQFNKVIGSTDAAKRGKDPEKNTPFYSNSERLSLIKSAQDNAFSSITGFAGAREQYQGEIAGDNTVDFANYTAAINTFNQNRLVANDPNLQNDAIALGESSKIGLDKYANGILFDVTRKAFEGPVNSETFSRREKSPTGILKEEDFTQRAAAGTLGRKGVYIVKKNDGSLQVVTYLGTRNVFDRGNNKFNYIVHGQVPDAGQNLLNNLQEF